MAGANPQRTSWVPDQVDPRATSNFGVEWYRPIEAYIGQHVQLITARGKIYISSARGLYALAADTGDEVWRFDTELPLGHSPTVVGNTVFVGGFDRRVYALNADTGALLWHFDEAKGAFSTNPLVVEGKVLLGSRDGYFYALDQSTGALVWRYPEVGEAPLGPILYSAAYANGRVFFAANDNFAYSLDVNSGALLWRSAKLPGDGYQAWWPVVYDNYVVFSAALPYAESADPGTVSVKDVVATNDPYYQQMESFSYGVDFAQRLQSDDVFYDSNSDLLGPTFASGSGNDTTSIAWSWKNGSTVVNAAKVTEYLENDGQTRVNRPTQKPWRRTVIVLNTTNGTEFTFDSDQDSFPEYAPFLYVGTKSGNRYPPLVIPTRNAQGNLQDVLYAQNMDTYAGGWGISRANVTAWQVGTQYLHPVNQSFAIDEPFANSAGGSILYTNLCCDRVGTWFNLETNTAGNDLWSYNLETQLTPGYDVMWADTSINDRFPRLFGAYGTINGIYHNHGLQNPIIPYQGRLFVHRSNAIIAFGPNPTSSGKRPLLTIGDPDTPPETTLMLSDVQDLLDAQITRMLQKGHLQPGYYNSLRNMIELSNYFENPGDTLLTLVLAYPLVSASLQPDLERYIKQHFQMFFADTMAARTGYWRSNPGSYDLNSPTGFGQLQPREWMPLPPEVALDMQQHPTDFWPGVNWPWDYPQHNFYAMWKYAELFYADEPATLQAIYALAKSRLQLNTPDLDTLIEKPWTHNGYIAGYEGFLHLQELAGKTQTDAALRTQVQSELDQLLTLRATDFRKDNPWLEDLSEACCQKDQNRRALNVARNFMNMSPELAVYLRENAFESVSLAIEEYEQVAPYWLAARYEASFGELASDNLYTGAAMFQAKAQILREPIGQLLKYIDMPAFETGDLFYIRNLVTVLTDPPPGIHMSTTSSAPLVLKPGNSATLTINVEAFGGYNDPVTLSVTSPTPDLLVPPASVTVTPPGQATITVQAAAAVSAASTDATTANKSYKLTIVATGEGVQETRYVTVQIESETLMLPFVSRINAPHFNGQVPFSEMAVAWFGEVQDSDNYVDVRVGYNDEKLIVDLAPFDRFLWFDETPSPADFTDWDTGSVYLHLDGNQGDNLTTRSYRFEGQLGWAKAAYQAGDAGWAAASLPFTTTVGWRGDGMNGGQEAKGWRVTFEIPFSSLGLTGPPPSGAIWGLALESHDRDDQAGSPIPVQVWPEAMETTHPRTWGQLRFGIPSFTPSTSVTEGEVSLRQGVNNVVVPDASVGGNTTCGGQSSLYFDSWGANNYAGEAQINIQNQSDIADWPCFSKYYVTFPLDSLPISKTVVSATLTMYMFGNSGQNPEPGWAPGDPEPSWIQVLTLAEDWQEENITWNNAPLARENIAGTWVAPVEFFDPGIPYTWDVTRAVAQANASGKPLRLVLYTAAAEYHSGKYFWSSDADEAVRPQLKIAWGPFTGPPDTDPPDTDPPDTDPPDTDPPDTDPPDTDPPDTDPPDTDNARMWLPLLNNRASPSQ